MLSCCVWCVRPAAPSRPVPACRNYTAVVAVYALPLPPTPCLPFGVNVTAVWTGRRVGHDCQRTPPTWIPLAITSLIVSDCCRSNADGGRRLAVYKIFAVPPSVCVFSERWHRCQLPLRCDLQQYTGSRGRAIAAAAGVYWKLTRY